MQNNRITRARTLAYVFLITSLLSAVLVYMSTTGMGFPDGHLTEMERAVKPLFVIYSIVALLFGVVFCLLALRIGKGIGITPLYWSMVSYAIVVVGLVVLYFFFASNLDHGGGG